MLFSEAMRLGAMLKQQAFGRAGDKFTSCANQAALEGSGLSDITHFPTAMLQNAPCPVEKCGRNAILFITCIHLNDDHRWTREKIATEFVEPIERGLGLWPLAEPTPELETITV